MQFNQPFFKLILLKDLLEHSSRAKQVLLDECINKGGADPVILMRRFRILSQLAYYESEIINKIYNFEITSPDDFVDNFNIVGREINTIIDRNS
jgi:hypothetical protein